MLTRLFQIDCNHTNPRIQRRLPAHLSRLCVCSGCMECLYSRRNIPRLRQGSLGCFPRPETGSYRESVSTFTPQRSVSLLFLTRFPRSELEASVKGYTNSIFRSCSSPADGNIKFQLFTQRVVEMFAGPDPDPFSSANARIPLPAQSGSQEVPTIRSATLAPIISQYLRPAPQVAESSKSALKRADSGSTLVSPMRRLRIPPSGDGWYVASDAVLPGVYCGL